MQAIARRWVGVSVFVFVCGFIAGHVALPNAATPRRAPVMCALTRTADDVGWWDGTRTHDYLRACSTHERVQAGASQEHGGP